MTAKHLLSQIVRGLDGVTDGPWSLHYEIDGPETQTRIKAGNKALATTAPQCGRPHWRDEMVVNAAHIARCSPDTIREIAAYVRDLEERLAKAAEALEPFARAAERIDTYYAEETGDQTPLDNGVIISTLIIGDDLSLFLLGDLRRARTALTTIRRTA